MEDDVIDLTMLKTPANYARMNGKTVIWAYQMMKRGKVSFILIDGKRFINLKNEQNGTHKQERKQEDVS